MLKNLSQFKGFTLIELMVTLVLIGILAKIAYPAYTNYLFKAHRTDGMSTLMSMQVAQEKYRYGNSTYGTLAQVWNNVAISPNGYYSLTVPANTSSSYTLTATAIGTQAADAENGVSCTPLSITVTGSSVVKTPSGCW